MKNISLKESKSPDFYESDNVIGDCVTTLKFSKEIDRLERFKNLYVFNFKDYFRIKLLDSTC